jgi:hypothetical protein
MTDKLTLATCKRCLVIGCKRPSEVMWTPWMAGKPDIPVCSFHFRRTLWWYKGTIYDHTEDGQS